MTTNVWVIAVRVSLDNMVIKNVTYANDEAILVSGLFLDTKSRQSIWFSSTSIIHYKSQNEPPSLKILNILTLSWIKNSCKMFGVELESKDVLWM